MSFVFVSHASQDKSAIRHIVDALIMDGHKVWLDNPAAMGYASDEVEAHFHRIRAGGRYRDEIDEALREAGAVLVCWSKRAMEDRKVWHAEATVARTLRKLVACRIDDVDARKLPDDHAAEQIPDLRRDRAPAELQTALALINADIRRKLAEVARQRLVTLKQQRRRDDFAPYLIDRTQQEDAIGTALEAVAAEGGVRAFFVAGPENECLDEFIDRLQRYACAARLGNGRSWHRVLVDWPTTEAPRDFANVYRRRLAREMQLSSSCNTAEIAAALSRQGKPVAVLSLLSAAEWRPDEERRMSEWLTLWRGLAAEAQRFAAVPLLCLKMPPARPGWRPAPGGTAPGAAMSNAAIWKAVARLQRKPGFLTALFRSPAERAPFDAPPLLHPVSRGDADRWLWHAAVAAELEGDAQEAKKLIGGLFAGRKAVRHGIALQDFATGLLPLFRSER